MTCTCGKCEECLRAQIAALRAENERLRERAAFDRSGFDKASKARDAALSEVAALKRAKAENDERFMTERDAARAEVAALKGEVAEARTWVRDLQSGMWINCVYCGHRYGPGDERGVIPGATTDMAEALTRHVAECPKHPMSAVRAEAASLRTQLEGARGRLAEQPAQWFDAGLSWAEEAAGAVLSEFASFNTLPNDAAATGAGKVHGLIFAERKRRRALAASAPVETGRKP